MMKVCMIGLGSIGSRHLKNLFSIAENRGISLTIDAMRSSKNPLPPKIEDLVSTVYYSFDDLPEDYDIALITNPTSMHFETIEHMLPKANHMFIEKPVFDRVNYDYKSLRWKEDGIYYVACPLRYHSVIKYLNDFVEQQQIFAIRSICSSYLPDWRPDDDYRKSYSANSGLGGGVRRDIIHEWDYLLNMFGMPLEVSCQYGKFSHLDINSEDAAVYTAKYADKLVSLHLDYFGRHSRREVELFTSDDVVVGDLIKKEIRFLNTGKIISLPQERDDMQREEIEAFLDMISGNKENCNDINMAVNTLKIAMGGECV